VKWLLKLFGIGKAKAKMPKTMVRIASKEIGIEEIGNSNKGPRVNEYKSATWMDATDSWPWCAAFVCWVVQQAMGKLGYAQTPTFRRPKTPRAFGFEEWCLRQDGTVKLKCIPGTDILPGDIVVFNFSHVGIASSKCSGEGMFECIEGNTDALGSREGGGVFKKVRHTNLVLSRIRFTK